MPELPEVEFARRCLERWWSRRSVDRVESTDRRLWRGTGLDSAAGWAGARVERVERRGKWIVAKRRGADVVLALHLGMTGKLVRVDGSDSVPRFTRVRFVDRGGSVCFVDPRRFGRCLVGSSSIVDGLAGVAELGPDAWSDPPDAAALAAKALGSTRPVRVFLLDQAVLAGLGNIQVTEALWKARLHPSKPAGELRAADWRRVVDSIHWSLERTLRDLSGADVITYVEEAGAPNPFVVYGRAKEPCPACRTPLVPSRIGGRTSVSCPRCQAPAR